DNTARSGHNGDQNGDHNGSGGHSGRHHGGGGNDQGSNNSSNNSSDSNDNNKPPAGPTTETFSGVEDISFRGLGGDDNRTHRLSGELPTDRDVRLDLGSGNDTATIDLAAGVNGAQLGLFVNGGRGDDTVDVTLGDVTDGDVTLLASLGTGNDTLTTTGTGDLSGFGSARLLAFGGGGDDSISFNLSGNVDTFADLSVMTDGGTGMDDISATLTGNVDGEATAPATTAVA